MFKFALCVLLGSCCANAATIAVSVNCGPGGSYQISPTSATCFGSGGQASAGIDANVAYQDAAGGVLNGILDVNTNTTPVHCFPPSCTFEPSANGTFTDDYVFTVTGGIGQALFEPCMFSGGVTVGSGANSSFASFGGLTVSNGNRSCFQGVSPVFIGSFTFGVPQTYTVSLSVQGAMGGFVVAELSGFQFFDPSGSPLTNAHFTLVSVDLSEPTALSLLGIGLMFFLAMRIRRMRLRGRFHGCAMMPPRSSSRSTGALVAATYR